MRLDVGSYIGRRALGGLDRHQLLSAFQQVSMVRKLKTKEPDIILSPKEWFDRPLAASFRAPMVHNHA